MKRSTTLFALVASVWASAAVAQDAAAKIGKPAPAFKLKDESGAEHSLEKYAGKVVVLEWTNPECPYVKRHYQAKTMQKTREGLDAQKVVWLAVDSTAHNTAEKSRTWRQTEGLSYPVLQDPSGEVGKKFGAKTTPHMFVIDEKGVLQYAGAIDDDPRGRSGATAVNHVKTAVEALLNGKAPPAATTQPYGCSVKYKSS